MKKFYRFGSALLAAFFAFTVAMPAVSAQVLVNEVMVQPSVEISDVNGEWIELVNTGATAVDINGWQIDGATISSTTTIPAGGKAVICRNEDSNVNGGVTCQATASIALSNSGQTLTLLDTGLNVIDSFDYTSSDVSQGSSIEVLRTGSTPEFNQNSTPTPGSNNPQPDSTVRNQRTGIVYTTIQAAINAASAGDTLAIAAGTYNEAVTVDRALTLQGVGDAASTGTIIDTPESNGITITASNVTLRDLRVQKQGSGDGIEITASSNALVFDGITATNGAQGLRVGSGVSVDGLTVTDSHFDGNTHGWYIAKETALSASAVFTNIDVSDTSFSNNTNKGLYAEKLSNALFDNVSVVNSGTNAAYNFNNGFDINLKWAAYTNITIQNSSFSGSGHFVANHSNGQNLSGALMVKARNDGSYAGTPASLSNVTITGNNFTATTSAQIVGLRFGEAGGNNAGPTGVTVSGNSFSGYATHIEDTTQADHNMTALKAANTFDKSATFAGATAIWSSVQTAVTAASPDDTVTIGGGTYAEDVTITKALTLSCARAGVDARNRTGAESVIRTLHISVSDVVVDGCSFNGDNAVTGQVHITSPSTLSGLVLQNNIFTNYQSVGIPTNNAGNIIIQRNHFHSPIGTAAAMQIKANSNPGGCTGTQVLNNLFTAATNSGGADINFSCTDNPSTNITVSGNVSTGNSGGSSFTALSGVTGGITITNNTASTEGSSVFFFGSVTGSVTISGNDFTSSLGSVIAIFGGDLGIDTPNTGTFNILNNDLSGGIRGIRITPTGLATGGKVIAHGNDLSGSSTAGLANLSPIAVDATANWWGAATEPTRTTNTAATGVNIIEVGAVSYKPWFINSSRTLLSTITGDVVVSGSEGQAQLPTTSASLVLPPLAVLNLNDTVQTTTTVTVGGNPVSTTQSIGGQTVTLGEKVTLVSASNAPIVLQSSAPAVSNVTVTIPDSTTVYAPAEWNGEITPPTAVTATGDAPSGFQFGDTVLKVGSDDVTLVFDQYVTLLLEDTTGPIAYQPAGSSEWFPVDECDGSFASPVAPVFPGECYVSDGTDTKILTFHFTAFASLEAAGGSEEPTEPDDDGDEEVLPPSRPVVRTTDTTTDKPESAPEVEGEDDERGTSSSTTDDTKQQETDDGFNWYIPLIGISVLAVIYYALDDRIKNRFRR